MQKKQYWQSFGEFTESDAVKQQSEDEFGSTLPFEELDGKGMLETKTPRRDFLKYLGFSTAAAMAAASCEMPVRHSIPFVNRPQDIVPGEANYYATTFIAGGDVVPVVAKVRDGRPIKLEGNTESTFTAGGTTARVQASVLDLYDMARLRFPMSSGKEVSTFEAFDKMVGDSLAGSQPVVILTSTISSPSTKAVIAEFIAKYPGSRHVQYDAISYSGLLLANELSYGKKELPSYKFDKADVIVSLGADFLGTWLSPIEYQNDYTKGRKIDEKNIRMNKHYHLESMMSMTGANADERYTHKPSETGAVAVALLNAVTGQGVPSFSNAKLTAGIKKIAADLLKNKGRGLVVSGSNNPSVQVVINAINDAIGSNGTTIDWSAPLLTKQGIDSDMGTLVSDMNSGKVGALLVYDVNPVYDYYNAEAFKSALSKVKLTVAFTQKMDETAEYCKFAVPTHHFLESWGDAEPHAGSFSMMQPTIMPLFKTRQFEDSLLKWSGNPTTYEAYFKNFWITKLGTLEAYEGALQKGVVETTATAAASATANGAALTAAVSAVGSMKKGGAKELVLYQNVAMGEGRQANNPWLLELPDPITKATWENYVMISPVLAKELFDIDITQKRQADVYEIHPEKPQVKVTIGSKSLLLPALIVPGMNPDTIAIAVGYGRKSKTPDDTKKLIGMASANAGQNVFQLASFNGTTIDFFAGDVTIAATGEKLKVAITQSHGSYEGRHEVVKETTLADFIKKPKEIMEDREKELAPWGGLENYREKGTLYPAYERPGVRWGMSIDLNSCYGCGACVVACTAENNVPVVGKSEVLRGHEMHWLRIDRYFSGNPAEPESIQTIFQPMLCQHCDNAPCENVCPVAATNHSSEGLNQMIYNRCIGTRYCANNCPYKVRRFNWLDFTGADSFPNNQDQTVVGKLDDAVFQMNDSLTRMVLNPDVTVRSRGVIEKCSFCVQRLQEGKLKAKKANRTLADADVKSACQQACAAGAIEFSNINNPESVVSKIRHENPLRTFYVLEQIHTLPSINYLAKVRNTDELSTGEPDYENKSVNKMEKEHA